MLYAHYPNQAVQLTEKYMHKDMVLSGKNLLTLLKIARSSLSVTFIRAISQVDSGTLLQQEAGTVLL